MVFKNDFIIMFKRVYFIIVIYSKFIVELHPHYVVLYDIKITNNTFSSLTFMKQKRPFILQKKGLKKSSSSTFQLLYYYSDSYVFLPRKSLFLINMFHELHNCAKLYRVNVFLGKN